MVRSHRVLRSPSTVAAAVLLLGAGLAAQRGDQRGDQRSNAGVGITIYADSNFRGQSQTFRDNVTDLRKFNMNDRVDSLQLGRGEVWEVCKDINYRGGCRTFTGDESDLGRIGWGGVISSLRRLKDEEGRSNNNRNYPPPPPMRPRLVLFDDIGFRGASYSTEATVSNLRVLGNRARSAKVYGGAWELCDGQNFRGRCVVLSENQPDLGRDGLRDKVSSVRPEGRGRGR